MSSEHQNLSTYDKASIPSAEGLKIHIAVSDWNKTITDKLLKGAKETLIDLGVNENDIEIIFVPGSFELPFAAKCLLKNKKTDAVICLGCVIKGATKHDDYINSAIASGLTQLSLVSDKPVIFGVLTVNDQDQAEERAGGHLGNKGVECAVTAVKMVQLSQSLSKPKKTIGY